jgi:hypothetical protein
MQFLFSFFIFFRARCYLKEITLSFHEIQIMVRSIFSSVLAKHAISDGTILVTSTLAGCYCIKFLVYLKFRYNSHVQLPNRY